MLHLLVLSLVLGVGWSQEPPPMLPPDIARSMEQGPKGVLAVRVVQGTGGGPAVGGEEVEVILFHRDSPIKQIKSSVGDQGVLMLTDLPVGIGIRPLVRVKHAGVVYQDAGPEMDAANPKASMDVTVYEVTDDTPQWKVLMRHVATATSPAGIDVAETLVVENPADMTWMGGPADEQGRRATVTLNLPRGAANIQLIQGFHGWCCTAYESGELRVQMPLMPGKATYRFAYEVPITEGAVDLRSAAPVVVDHAAYFVPEAVSLGELALLREAGTDTMGDQRVRLLQAQGVPGGQAVGLVLTGLATAPPPLPAKAPGGVSSPMVIGGVVVAVVVGVIIGVRIGARKRGGASA